MRLTRRLKLIPATIGLSILACGRAQSPPDIVIGPISGLVGSGHTLSRNLGLETLGGVFTPLLNAGCATPCSRTETFSTAADGQEQITLTVHTGTATLARDTSFVGRFQVFGIPAAPRGKPRVAISFVVTPTGHFGLTAIDATTGQRMPLRRLLTPVQDSTGA